MRVGRSINFHFEYSPRQSFAATPVSVGPTLKQHEASVETVIELDDSGALFAPGERVTFGLQSFLMFQRSPFQRGQ